MESAPIFMLREACRSLGLDHERSANSGQEAEPNRGKIQAERRGGGCDRGDAGLKARLVGGASLRSPSMHARGEWRRSDWRRSAATWAWIISRLAAASDFAQPAAAKCAIWSACAFTKHGRAVAPAT